MRSILEKSKSKSKFIYTLIRNVTKPLLLLYCFMLKDVFCEAKNSNNNFTITQFYNTSSHRYPIYTRYGTIDN